jgi:hypothetical protein
VLPVGARLARFAEWWMHGATKILYNPVLNAAASGIAHIIHMSDEPAMSLDVDVLVNEAYECLSLFRKRDMPDSLEITLVEKAVKADNATRKRL